MTVNATPAASTGTSAAPVTSAPAPAAESKSLLDAPQNTTEGANEGGSLLDTPVDAAAEGTPKGEAQAAESKPDAASKPDKAQEQKPAQGAPEKYADFKLPEGLALDTGMADEFKGVAKEMNLSQDAAQKLVNLQAKYAKAQSDAILSQYKQQVEGWKKETIQHLGAEYKKELSFAAKAMDRFGSPELKALLNDSGLANHKDVVSFCQKIGKAISEDVFVSGKQTAQGKDAASVLYPNHSKP